MNIVFDDNNIDTGIKTLMGKALEACLQKNEIAKDNVEVSVTFVQPDEIQTLNKMYRNMDKPTDVLSFPQYQSIEEIREASHPLLGDVVINTELAREQASLYGHSFEREMVYLFTHSILHLMGYDHMEDTEKKAMRAFEEAVMDSIGLHVE